MAPMLPVHLTRYSTGHPNDGRTSQGSARRICTYMSTSAPSHLEVAFSEDDMRSSVTQRAEAVDTRRGSPVKGSVCTLQSQRSR